MEKLQLESLIYTHRGVIWKLQEGMDLPVWGSIFSEKLTTKLHLDFNNFKQVSKSAIDDLYSSQRETFEIWYKNMPENLQKYMDAKTFFLLLALQNGIKTRLNISDTPATTEDNKKRNMHYKDTTIPNLSDFADGSSFCAERAALWQYLLQEIWIPSFYMSGVSYYEDIDDGADHSWIVLYPNTDNALIWDVARPHQNYPNLYRHEGGISMSIFEWSDNCFVRTQKLLGNSERYFGVSDHPNLVNENFSPEIISSKVAKHLP